MNSTQLSKALLAVFVLTACSAKHAEQAMSSPHRDEYLAMEEDSQPALAAEVQSPARKSGLADSAGRFERAQALGVLPHSPSVAEPFDTEAYDHIQENGFHDPKNEPLSTFSIDVDTASYANVRRFLTQQHRLPPKDAVRVEELLNYFSYDYAPPSDEHPFAVHLESARAPWHEGRQLVRIGVQAKEIEARERKRANLVFLLDVSGSMEAPNKLPLLKRGMKMLVEQLDERDRVAIVVYAGASGVVLPSTPASHKAEILEALERLRAGGSTHGAAGIRLAYDIASRHFVRHGINRVIIATDGDFNVGTTSRGELVRLIEKKRESDVFLSVLGFGLGNYKDATLEELARHGNGNYAYIDSPLEARKVLVEQMNGTLVTVAKDVKIQVEFNPQRVQAYRLIGYENRMLRARDFNDDQKDAGEIGAGHSVTALYELVPVGEPIDLPSIDPLRYRSNQATSTGSSEMLTVKLRYKQPTEQRSVKIEIPFEGEDRRMSSASADLRFAAAVAGFGMLLRESEHRGSLRYDDVLTLARSSMSRDEGAYRAEFVRLVEIARTLQ
jgi:Ca-activated chloride channel family protein